MHAPTTDVYSEVYVYLEPELELRTVVNFGTHAALYICYKQLNQILDPLIEMERP